MSVTASAKLLNSKQEAVKWLWWCDDIKDKVVSVNLKVGHRDFYLMHLNIIALFVLCYNTEWWNDFPSMIPQVRETVLTFISENGQHQKLLKTKHFQHLKQLIVSNGQPNQVKDLVDYLISQNW